VDFQLTNRATDQLINLNLATKRTLTKNKSIKKTAELAPFF